MFLALFSYIILANFTEEVSVYEMVLMVWVFTIFTEEIRQVVGGLSHAWQIDRWLSSSSFSQPFCFPSDSSHPFPMLQIYNLCQNDEGFFSFLSMNNHLMRGRNSTPSKGIKRSIKKTLGKNRYKSFSGKRPDCRTKGNSHRVRRSKYMQYSGKRHLA